MRWIKVKDELPNTSLGSIYKYSEIVAVISSEWATPLTARYEHGAENDIKWEHWFCFSLSDSLVVTHWMPLPELPKQTK